MKKIIKIFAALVICTSVVMFSSCKEDPVDKQLDKMEALLNKFDKLATDDNPTPKELMSFQNDVNDLRLSLATMPKDYGREDQLTEKQGKRLLAIMQKTQISFNSANYQRLQRLARQYQLNY